MESPLKSSIVANGYPEKSQIHTPLEAATVTNNMITSTSFIQNEEQPLVKEVSSGKHSFLQNMYRKRKRKRGMNGDFLGFDIQNLQRMKNSHTASPLGPPSPGSSMVTVLKYHNGDYVEVERSLPTYNSPMSLRDMRNAITASLQNCINQSALEFEATPIRHWSTNQKHPPPAPTPVSPQPNTTVNAQPQEGNVDKAGGSNATEPEEPKEMPSPNTSPKVKKPNVSVKQVKKMKSPSKEESLKFERRQKELMKIRKELKKKNKQDVDDPDTACARAIWGRTVGVTCTMCGKHVQKSYGCFRRDTAPDKLMHLFEPGMNRIKICRRCLPYKKQTPGGDDLNNKKRAKKPGEKDPANDPQRLDPGMAPGQVVDKPSSDITGDKSREKQKSTGMHDAIQCQLTAVDGTAEPGVSSSPRPMLPQPTADLVTADVAFNPAKTPAAANETVSGGGACFNTSPKPATVHVTPDAGFNLTALNMPVIASFSTSTPAAGHAAEGSTFKPPPKIILGETGKGEAMQYIKKLAENLKASYNSDLSQSSTQVQPPLAQQLVTSLPVTPLTPVPPSSNLTNLMTNATVSGENTKHCASSHPVVSQWTPLVLNQKPSPVAPLSNVVAAAVRQNANKETGSSVMTTPPWTPMVLKHEAAKISAASSPPSTTSRSGAAATGNSIQILGKVDGNKLQTIPAIMVSSQNAVNPPPGSVLLQIQRVKLVREKPGESQEAKLKPQEECAAGKTKVLRPIVCDSCKSNVVKSYRCVNHSSCPPKMKHLFNDDNQVLRICRKCLFSKNGEPQHTGEEKVTTEDLECGQTLGDQERRATGDKAHPCTLLDNQNIKADSTKENTDIQAPFGTLMDTQECRGEGISGNDSQKNDDRSGFNDFDVSGNGSETSVHNKIENVPDVNVPDIVNAKGLADTSTSKDAPDYFEQMGARVDAIKTEVHEGSFGGGNLETFLGTEGPRMSFEDLGAEFMFDAKDSTIGSVVSVETIGENVGNVQEQALKLPGGEDEDSHAGMDRMDNEHEGSEGWFKDSSASAKQEVLDLSCGTLEGTGLFTSEITSDAINQGSYKEHTHRIGGPKDVPVESRVGPWGFGVETGGLGPPETRDEATGKESAGTLSCEKDTSEGEVDLNPPNFKAQKHEKTQLKDIERKGEQRVEQESQGGFSDKVQNRRESVAAGAPGDSRAEVGLRHRRDRTGAGMQAEKAKEGEGEMQEYKQVKHGKESGEVLNKEAAAKNIEAQKSQNDEGNSCSTQSSDSGGIHSGNTRTTVKSSPGNKSVPTDEKTSRKRRVGVNPKRSPGKTEKKIEPKCHYTRGAFLKEKKEAGIAFEKKLNEGDILSEETQGVRRKNEKRQRRGKKARSEEEINDSTVEETKTGKQDVLSTKEVRSSPLKRKKTRKD